MFCYLTIENTQPFVVESIILFLPADRRKLHPTNAFPLSTSVCIHAEIRAVSFGLSIVLSMMREMCLQCFFVREVKCELSLLKSKSSTLLFLVTFSIRIFICFVFGRARALFIFSSFLNTALPAAEKTLKGRSCSFC